MNIHIPAARFAVIVIALSTLASCAASLTSSLIGPALDNMAQQSDVELVCEGTPAYLLMIDSLVAENPGSKDLLILATKGYSGFVGAMVSCEMSKGRIQAIADKAHDYSLKLLEHQVQGLQQLSLAQLQLALEKASAGDTSRLFWGVFGWTTWVEQQRGAPAAMADLAKIEAILLRIVEIEPSFEQGAAHFLLGAYYGSRPLMFGGNPGKSTYHFEQAFHFSDRKRLIYHTTCAKTLALTTMDKKLYSSLLSEVTSFDLASAPENMLINAIAKRQAVRMLEESLFPGQ